ncbi:hypothetical protein KAX17_05020 [Candidatus Bipolaricaulota bacterium]|nr:hypothetical protein [Candidatus Bipolaricaulota bacterium]
MKVRLGPLMVLTIVLGLVAAVLCCYGEGNGDDATFTQIVIDGQPDDWSGRCVVGVDSPQDAETGFLDLSKGYAFVNQNALYLLVETINARAPFVQFDMFIEAGGKMLLLSWSPGQAVDNLADITTGFEYIGPAIHSSFAFGPALEVRVDLQDLGSPERVNLNRITVMVGECCQPPAWRAADEWRPTRSTPVVDEIDAALAQRAQRTERPGHVLMAAGDVKADYLYRGFIQIPGKIAWGPDGHLYIADQLGRHVVRLSPNGTMSDLGTWRNPSMWNDDGPRGIAFDSNGNLYVNDHRGGIYAIGPDGDVEVLPGIRGQPVGGVTFSSNDELYYTDMGGGRVLKIGADGESQVVARGIENAFDLVFGSDGELYVSQNSLDRVVRVDVTTGEVSEFFSAPISGSQVYLAIDEDGDLWIRGYNRLYQLAPDGTQKPFYVNGKRYSGDASELDIQTPGGITFDDQGRLWIASYNSSIRYFSPPQPGQQSRGMSVTEIAPGLASGSGGADLEISGKRDLYVYNHNSSPGEIWRISPQGNIEVLLQIPDKGDGNIGMALDAQGKLYLGMPNGEIAWLDTNGTLQHYAWLRSWHMTFASDGYLYAAVGGGGEPKSIVRITGVDRYETLVREIDGQALGIGPGSRYGPANVRILSTPGGELLVYDEGHMMIYSVELDGQVSVFADFPELRQIRGPAPIAVAPDGSVFINLNDAPYPLGYSLLRIHPNGDKEIYAREIYGDPLGAVVSPDGHWLYIAENGAIDKIEVTNRE